MAKHSRESSGTVSMCWSPLVSPFTRLFKSNSSSTKQNSPPVVDRRQEKHEHEKVELKEDEYDEYREDYADEYEGHNGRQEASNEFGDEHVDMQNHFNHPPHPPQMHSLSPHSSSIYPQKSVSQISVAMEQNHSTSSAPPTPTKNQHRYSNNSMKSSGRRSSRRHPSSYVAEDNSNVNNNNSKSPSLSPNRQSRSSLKSPVTHRPPPPSPKPPKTWSQYESNYAHGRINSQPPPFEEDTKGGYTYNNSGNNSPVDAYTGSQVIPNKIKSQGYYPPPKPPSEKERLLTMRRLDLFGEYGPPPVSDSRGAQLPDYFPNEEESLDATLTYDDYSQQYNNPPPLPQKRYSHNRITSTDFNKLHKNRQSIITTSDHALTPSLLESPAFRRIVRHARRVFNVKTCMLSVLEDDQQLFLAESGVGGKAIPREISFCAHTILAGNDGFVVLDADKDWRFKSSPVTKELGARFYAGVPLLCPDLTGVDSSGTEYPIGTLCITDPRPRETFTQVEQDELHWLASRARAEIEIWFRAREEAKRKLMDVKFTEWKTKMPSSRPNSSAGLMNSGVNRPVSMVSEDGAPSITDYASCVDEFETDRGDFTGNLAFDDYEDEDEDQQERLDGGSEDMLSVQERGGGGAGEDNNLINPYAQVFDTAVQLIKSTLDLSLVYLVVMDFEEEYAKIKNGNGNISGGEEPLSIKLDVLASRGLPDPPPVFDITLHIRALRAPEGGLLYQNERLLQYNQHEVQEQYEMKHDEYASAILVPVDEIELAAKGYVLAAFTKDVRKAFEMEDFTLMRKVASELRPYVDEHASESLNE